MKTAPPASVHDVLVPEPSKREFEAFRTLIHERAGIYLNESKNALLHSRLVRRVRDLGLASFAEYFCVVTSDGDELVELLDRITTNETHFFREPQHFALLEQTWIPATIAAADAAAKPRQVRVWSAGCSTGEEPYSIAMTLLDKLPGASFTIDVLATDLSTRVLDHARAATWSTTRASAIPDVLRRRYMLRGVGPQTGLVRAAPELRALVRVERLNLSQDPFPKQEFDLVFCRNVLIYFHPTERQKVLERLIGRLAPRGLLFVGHAESAQGLSAQVDCVIPTVYRRRPESPSVAPRRGR